MAKAQVKTETVVNREVILSLSIEEAIFLRTLFGWHIGATVPYVGAIVNALSDVKIPFVGGTHLYGSGAALYHRDNAIVEVIKNRAAEYHD